MLRRSLGDLEGDARRATRRSFFRRKKHQRSDSKELASFSNINLGWYSDSGTLNEETALASYQRVTRLNCKYLTLAFDILIILTRHPIIFTPWRVNIFSAT